TLPEEACMTGNAILVGGGTHALVPLASVAAASKLWFRNGLGQLAEGHLVRRLPDVGIAVARLETSLPFDADLEIAPRAPFPGSIAYAVEYADGGDAGPSWPHLASGFVGRAMGHSDTRQLDFGAPSGERGGPVFDAFGRLVGIVLPAEGAGKLIPASRLR